MKYLVLALFAIILGMFTDVTATEVTAQEKGIYFDTGTHDVICAYGVDLFTPVALVYIDDGLIYEAKVELNDKHYNLESIQRPNITAHRRARDGLMCSAVG
jgi:hypothetical protein